MIKTNTIIFLKDLLEEEGTVLLDDSSEKASFKYNADIWSKPSGNIVVKDIPGYFSASNPLNPEFKIKSVKTNEGYLIKLDEFENPEEYFNQQMSSKSRSNLRRYKNRLESCFQITYRAYYGAIEAEEYTKLFNALRQMLEKRFEQKNEKNYELPHLEGFEHIVYGMILAKTASLFVIYSGNTPISIRLNMFKEKWAFYILSGYNIAYSKFHIGWIDMSENIKWLFLHGFKQYDLLKGYADYKKKWYTDTYQNENHFIYCRSNIKSVIRGVFSFLRHKFVYSSISILKSTGLEILYKHIRKRFRGVFVKKPKAYTVEILYHDKAPEEKLIDVDINNEKNPLVLREAVYNFLFLKRESLVDTTLFKVQSSSNKYFIKGKKHSQTVVVK
ncbi:GNAT family N-acetyltransferase [Flagellimonas meridianipacifica]|uniref:Acetyltransferase (GNAT) family protein n=1 Tax=Flagellimonas meridianipacifica TaxID=1080225 RepID=A0A2T0MCQ7_9FLAO|nr:GNAT family N-acetyltransferase [Allomuricauda pacifica]PRX55278.1 acetyltransferase (GNAT) family protein [Allomuricauda pacifica]